ncbi:hypothetical protein GcC1_183036b [Golovinomyces cichoracearum]|uniref:Uncharacterized protein n=1 Tax=Golovinomyces cichoracearum TaxID=62708 RepID=A0A420HLR4_9PEZI|nr:hypothetical protein GcC1_183036b [Golovinomyces cichoracearum]
MFRLRILVLWVAKTPQRKKQWQLVYRANGLSEKFIEYNVDTRWSSTYRILQDAIKAKPQIEHWIELQSLFPPFKAGDRHFIQQVANVLEKFEEFTLTISQRSPQITLAVPIYYELHDLLDDAMNRTGDFVDLSTEFTVAVSAGMNEYKKYYDFMDAQDAYYTALTLDPQFKTLLIEKEMDKESANTVVESLKNQLGEQYPWQQTV